MKSRSLGRRRRALAASLSAAVAVGLSASTLPSSAGSVAGSTGVRDSAGTARTTEKSHGLDKGYYDVRTGASAQQRAALTRDAAEAGARPGLTALRSALGTQAVIDMDGLTGTPRQLARLDGFLTGRSSLPASTVALRYVRAHASALGLTAADISGMTLRRDYVDIAGIHHLSFVQSAGGVPLFGNGLQVNVTRDGRLISLGGSPVSGLTAPALGTSVVSGSAAITVARRDLGESLSAGPDDTARAVLFQAPGGTRRGWETITMSAKHPALTVVDSATGAVLYRQPLENDAVSDERPAKPDNIGVAYRYFPGARVAGEATRSNFSERGWLPRSATRLHGNNTTTWSDVNDDDKQSPNEQVRSHPDHRWTFRLKPFHLKHVSFCDNPYPCSWNPNKPYSWRTNRKQNATQVFFYVNTWHDHLERAPIGFTEAAGNFQEVNSTDKGEGGDPVKAQSDDGAAVDDGLPDGGHVDNANMATPPDGRSPRMQMYLQHQPGTSYPDGDPFAPTNVGDEADTVYHEYTHGLSNRLVVDASGRSTLGGVQAGAMGEAWSDWYAMDYLVKRGYEKDKPRSGDVVLFQYDGAGVALDRTEPLDCAVGATTGRCGGGLTGHGGGYTYADYAKVIGGPEVHSDGEIWAQTLWDLRSRIGSRVAESVVTRAMELSPANPSFLDERNAILLADMAVYGGDHTKAIWGVFAHRGMGYYAGALSGNDTSPGADFHRPPPQGTPIGGLTGRITDSVTGDPIANATVVVAWHGSPFATNPSATTNDAGRYSLGPVPVGRYPKLVVVGPQGYDSEQGSVRVTRGTTTHNVTLRRDWAASAGGATQNAEGPDFGGGCNGAAAIDQSTSTGWASTVDPDADGEPTPDTPKTITITLPNPVDVTSVQVNPTSVCGLGLSASTGDYSASVSTDGGTTWSTPIQGTFTAQDRGHLNPVDLPADTDGVTDVRFTMRAPQVFTDTATYPPPPGGNCPGAYSGCDYQAVTEIEVFGEASP